MGHHTILLSARACALASLNFYFSLCGRRLRSPSQHGASQYHLLVSLRNGTMSAPAAAAPAPVAAEGDSPPTTVLVILGPMEFDAAGTTDVMSVKIRTREERGPTLEAAGQIVKPSSLEAMHVILKSSTVSSLYDESIITTFVEALGPGAECTVHVLGSVDSPVQPADVNDIRASFLMANLMLEQEGLTEGDEGGWTLTARKPRPGGNDDEDDDNDEEGGKVELTAIAEEE